MISKKSGALAALTAAALFGASTPVIKFFFADIPPVMLAGLLNLGSGGGLAIWRFVLKNRGAQTRRSLSRGDVPWFAAAILSGGIIAPVLLMFGLSRSTGSAASLLLNSESAFTALLAGFIFKEHIGARVWLGLASVTLGSALVTWSQEPHAGIPLGGLAIAGACLFWGLDNNFTRKISDAEPTQITAWKGLCAGIFNVLLSLAIGNHPPAWPHLAGVLTLGLFSYGISLTLFVVSLRELGAGRTGAYFATAPFVGATLSVAILREPLTGWLLASAALMASGVWLLLTEGLDGAASNGGKNPHLPG